MSNPEFNSKIISLDQCWYWAGYTDKDGYGFLSLRLPNGKSTSVRAPRLLYENLVGKIPMFLQLDHLCRNRICVNPDHLEPVTPKENVLRSLAPPAINSRKTECKYNHLLKGDNLYVRRDGKRQCIACRKRLQFEYNQRKVRIHELA